MDHNGFSTRDEVAYQFARDKREGQLLDYYQNQGMNDNYPQYGTDFWGSAAENNYGFGQSDIEGNIPKIIERLDSGGMDNQQNIASDDSSAWSSVKNFAQNAVNTMAPYIPTYYAGYAIGTAQNVLPQIKNNLADAYNIYQNKGFYSVGEKYAEPSVRRALQAKKYIEPLEISDVNKHQYVSCVGSTDGLLATAETLAGGVYKELQDTKDKLTNPELRKAYGGTFGVLDDAIKDLGNDFIGSTAGYICGKYNIPEGCNLLLNYPIKLRK